MAFRERLTNPIERPCSGSAFGEGNHGRKMRCDMRVRIARYAFLSLSFPSNISKKRIKKIYRSFRPIVPFHRFPETFSFLVR